MNLDKIAIRLFATPDSSINDELLIPVFHEWCRHAKYPHILIDVADYRHVPDGPGILLVAHEANISVDWWDGRQGLTYQRKTGAGGEQSERIQKCVQNAIYAADLLEADEALSGTLKFDRNEFLFQSNDRLNAPNDAETFESLRPEIEKAFGTLFSHGQFTLSRIANDPKERLSVLIRRQ